MLDNEIGENFFQNIDQLWIKPELERRFGENGIPGNFVIREALIKLPHGQTSIVEFNEEIGWEVEVKAAPNIQINPGQPVQFHEFENLDYVLPPSVNGQRVAFIYLFWDGSGFRIMFDFGPNQPDFDPVNSEFNLGNTITAHLKAKFLNQFVSLTSQNAITHLQQIGLWIATPLLPYPLTKIVERLWANKPDEARQALIDHCNGAFLESLIKTWSPIKSFKEREQIFQEALKAHEYGLFHASISTLITQIEGVIGSWLVDMGLPKQEVWKLDFRVKKLNQLLSSIPDLNYAYQEALKTLLKFLQTDKDNVAIPFQKVGHESVIDPNFPSRHAISHGEYIPKQFTQENSIKLFLLLDTLCQFMMFYEVRVLHRNLG